MAGDVTSVPSTPAGRVRRPRRAVRRPGRVAVVVVGLLAVVNLLVYVGLKADSGTEPAHPMPPAVRRLEPAPGSLVSPQDAIQVTLADGLTGVLAIDGRPVPEDQITFTGVTDLSFRPGPGREWSRWSAGTRTATVTYWPETGGRSHARSFDWTFRVGA